MSHTGDGIWRKLPWIFVVIPFLILLAAGALLYQALAPLHDSLNWQRQEFRAECNMPGAQCSLTVTVSYPAALPLEAPGAPGLPLRVWLTDGAAVASQPLTYTVTLESPIAEISFTDQDGQPIAPGAAILLESTRGAPAIWYIRQTPHDTDGLVSLLATGSPELVSIALRVFDPKHAELVVSPPTFSINAESSRQALWRRFLQIVLGPTTSILSLVAALIGAIWRKHGQQHEHERQIESFQQETKVQLDDLAALLRTDRPLAVNRYVHLSNQEQVQENPTMRSRINAMWVEGWKRYFREEVVDALVKGDFVRAHWLKTESDQRNRSAAEDRTTAEATSERGYAEMDDALMPVLERLSTPAPLPVDKVKLLISLAAQRDKMLNEAQALALVQTLHKTLDEKGALEAFLDNSKTLGGAVAWLTAAPQIREYCRQIAANPDAGDAAAARGLLRLTFERISWPSLWQSTWTESNAGILQALARLGWNQNPFGPERAEEDDRLGAFWVPSPVQVRLAAMEPILLLTETACGQTTALWHLVDTYQKSWQATSEISGDSPGARVFPVLMDARNLLRAQTRSQQLSEVAFVCARALLTFLSRNPSLFLATPSDAQRAISRLVAAYPVRLGELRPWLTAATQSVNTQNDFRSRLRQALTNRFSEEELRTLCFDIGLDYENLPTQGKAGKAREIVAQVERNGGFPALIEQCRSLRPDMFWEDPPEAASDISALPDGSLPDRLSPCGVAPSAVWLAEAFSNARGEARPLHPADTVDILFTLGEARLAGSAGYVVAADVSSRHLKFGGATALAARLKPLVSAMPELAMAGVFLKLGIPPVVGHGLPDDIEVTRVDLGLWATEDLHRVLDRRVEKLGALDGSGPGGGLNMLLEKNAGFDPANKMIAAAAGSPQRLVRLGNRLLARYGQKAMGSGLSQDDFDVEVCDL